MTANEDRFLKLPQVREKTGLGTTSIYSMIKKNEFPKQLRLGKRASRWRESDVIAWMQQQAHQ